MRGRFITFEGLDGSGKSTHLSALAERLAGLGIDCETTHEPGGTPLGDEVRRIFLDPRRRSMDGVVELLLLFASRRQLLTERIEPALAAGRWVLSDRFTDSTLVYQGLGRGVPREAIDAVDRVATAGRRPDRTLVFDLPPEAARERGHGSRRRRDGSVDRLDDEDLAFYGRVRAGFLELARTEPERFRVIDSSGEREETVRRVWAAVEDLLPAGAPGGPAGALGEAREPG